MVTKQRREPAFGAEDFAGAFLRGLPFAKGAGITKERPDNEDYG